MSVQLPAATWKDSEQSALRVLIVDDSVVVRTVLSRIISPHADFEIRHKTSNAEQALAYLEREQVDIVLLDIEMPGQSGLAALPSILRAGRGARVIILSGNCDEGSAAAVEALALGASDILAKPGSGRFGDQFSNALLERLRRLAGRGPVARGADAPAPISLQPRPAHPLGCLAIGASTGGIHALGQLFAALPGPLGVPILVTQHLPPSFIPYFATQLSRMTSLPVKLAEDGEKLLANHVYVAPGEANLCCRKSPGEQAVVMLTPDRAPSGSLPGVDPMFSAVARCYGRGAGGVVLTGMGRDGTMGARQIVSEGGWVVAQDEATSVVWGMPGSVARQGLASILLPPPEILPYIARSQALTA